MLEKNTSVDNNILVSFSVILAQDQVNYISKNQIPN